MSFAFTSVTQAALVQAPKDLPLSGLAQHAQVVFTIERPIAFSNPAAGARFDFQDGQIKGNSADISKAPVCSVLQNLPQQSQQHPWTSGSRIPIEFKSGHEGNVKISYLTIKDGLSGKAIVCAHDSESVPHLTVGHLEAAFGNAVRVHFENDDGLVTQR